MILLKFSVIEKHRFSIIFLFNYILFYSQVETLSLIDEKYPYEKTKVCGLTFLAFVSTIFWGYFLYLGIR